MATWEFLSKRRRMKLEDFVKGAKTLEEAKAVFERKKVDLPVDGSLEKLFAKPIPVKKTEKPKAEVTKAEVTKPKAEGNVSYTGGMQVEVKEPVVVTKAAVVEEAKPAKKTTRKKKATKKKSTKASDEG